MKFRKYGKLLVLKTEKNVRKGSQCINNFK